VLGWRVEDLDATLAAMRSRGVEPKRSGNTLSLQQAP
jgi:hypothetical protein